MDFVGGLIRYKVAINNSTEMSINSLAIELKMAAEHIRIIDVKPRTYKKGDRAEIPNMLPNQSVSIDFYLEPMICGKIPVHPIANYIDAYGKPKMVLKDPLVVESKCPPIANLGEENVAMVKNIFEDKRFIRSFRSSELERDPNNSFNVLREAVGAWAGKPVSEPIYESDEPLIVEIYYLIQDQHIDPELGHREQIIIRIKVNERKNIAILSVAAEENSTVTGVITHIWQLAEVAFQKFLLCLI